MIGELLRIRYQILEELSSSPIFDSYIARDRVRNVDVCVRLVNRPFSDEPEFVLALKSVVEKTKVLDHPNIARVYEIDEHEGRPFIVCELVRGSNLVERIRRVAPFSPPIATEIAIGICEALEHAAVRGMVHGDLCSDHVITSLEGRVAVIDFGLWESYGRSGSAGAMVLARMAPYLAPEIIEGELPSTSSDVYAVGVILFELLAARLPFSGQTPMSILAKHTTQAVPSIRSLNVAVPHVLDEIVSKALAKDRTQRYQSASELLSDLRALRDAMRFGRQLTWPIKTEARAQPDIPPAKTFNEKRAERKMGTVAHVENRANVKEVSTAPAKQKVKVRTPEKVRGDDDVPSWLKAIVYVLSGMAVAFVVGWMILNLTKKKELEVPNLIGMQIAQAREQAKALGVNLSVMAEEYNEKFPQPETIIEMDPAPKTPVREGAYVRVKLSLGSTYVDIPDLRGVTKEEARRRLEAAGLLLAQRIKEQRSDTLDEGMVIETEPKHGERVERNTTVEITVSSGRTRPTREERGEEEQQDNTWTLRFKVRDGDMIMVRVEMTDATGEARNVFEELREGGTYVSLDNVEGKGKEATFRIYFDNTLWRTLKRQGNNT